MVDGGGQILCLFERANDDGRQASALHRNQPGRKAKRHKRFLYPFGVSRLAICADLDPPCADRNNELRLGRLRRRARCRCPGCSGRNRRGGHGWRGGAVSAALPADRLIGRIKQRQPDDPARQDDPLEGAAIATDELPPVKIRGRRLGQPLPRKDAEHQKPARLPHDRPAHRSGPAYFVPNMRSPASPRPGTI